MGDEENFGEVPPVRPTGQPPKPYFFDSLSIYCSTELKKEFVDFANAEFGGRQYLALTHLLKWWNESHHVHYMMAKIEEHDERIRAIEEAIRNSKSEPEEDKKIKTFGGDLDG